ncbi:MAG: hypothetical protein H7196_03640 [candidate division SR1 bacterium]|nr:hypothetical protein [candidate division SR1 bacterium]
MNSNDFLVQDFKIGETTQVFEYNGKTYIALLEYDPKQDMRAFLYIYEGNTIPEQKSNYAFHAWISALAADYSGRENSTSWCISHVVEIDKTLRPLFLDTMLRSFMTRPKKSSIASFSVGSPKWIITINWLNKYRLNWVNDNVIITSRHWSICPEETPLSKLLNLV